MCQCRPSDLLPGVLLSGWGKHLIHKPLGIPDLLDQEEQVADVQGDVAAYFRIEMNVAHRAFPDPVEIESYQLAVRIQDRASGVASRGVIGRKEADRLVLVAACGIDVAQFLRNVVVEYFRIVLLDDALKCGNRLVTDSIRR